MGKVFMWLNITADDMHTMHAATRILTYAAATLRTGDDVGAIRGTEHERAVAHLTIKCTTACISIAPTGAELA